MRVGGIHRARRRDATDPAGGGFWMETALPTPTNVDMPSTRINPAGARERAKTSINAADERLRAATTAAVRERRIWLTAVGQRGSTIRR
jgi:hypothetical protein